MGRGCKAESACVREVVYACVRVSVCVYVCVCVWEGRGRGSDLPLYHQDN